MGQTYDVEAISSHTGEVLHWIAILASNTLGHLYRRLALR
jgi:uncharacterized membrane-anchored protein